LGDFHSSVTFFDRTFDETCRLVVEARDYVHQLTQDKEPATPMVRLITSCETMRLTARLTQIMAWLLVQKAVHAGELGRAEARRTQHRLGGRGVCLAVGSWGVVRLSPRLQRLLDRSHALYERIARLDDMMGNAAPGRRPSRRKS
jgi:regulator of CtrA degradation